MRPVPLRRGRRGAAGDVTWPAGQKQTITRVGVSFQERWEHRMLGEVWLIQTAFCKMSGL